MTQQEENQSPFDPAGMFKDFRDAGMDAWAKTMVQLVNTDAYAEATGAMLNTWLTSSGPFRQTVENSLTHVLGNLNLPSRDEITQLAQRLTHIEMRLDDLDAKLDDALRTSSRSSPSTSPSGKKKK